MQGKTIIITGGSDGIGKAIAKSLKQKMANVVILGRSPEKTQALAEELGATYYICDFSKLKDVRKLGKQLRDTYPQIDVLINNAGGIFDNREVTDDGFEKTFQVNHLAHFLLTSILLDNLIASKATVINTSSVANRYLSRLDISDLNMVRKHNKYRAYGNAKLENILFTKELHRRFGAQGLSAVAFHPGTVATNFADTTSGLMRLVYQTPLRKLVRLITPEEGAMTAVWLATSVPGKDWQPGEYYFKTHAANAHKLAYDKAIAKSLWQQSEAMTGADYSR